MLDSGFAEVVHQLEVHPKFGAVAEIFGEAQRRVGRYGTLTVDDLINASRWDAKIRREPVLTDGKRGHELFEEHLARVRCPALDFATGF